MAVISWDHTLQTAPMNINERYIIDVISNQLTLYNDFRALMREWHVVCLPRSNWLSIMQLIRYSLGPSVGDDPHLFGLDRT